MMNDVFERTWGERAGPRPRRGVLAGRDRRRQATPRRLRRSWPRRTGTSSTRSSSRASTTATTSASTTGSSRDDAEAVRGHLSGDVAYQSRLVRFVENHDEPRAAATFPPAQARAAAVDDARPDRRPPGARGPARRPPRPAAGLPRPPPGRAARRRPPRRSTSGSSAASRDPVFRDGDWQLAERRGWDGNETLARASSRGAGATTRRASWSSSTSARPAPPATSRCRGTTSAAASWRLADAASGEVYERSGDDLRDGLYVALDAVGVAPLRPATVEGELIPRCRPHGPPSTRASPRRRAAPRTTSSPRTPGTSGART